VHQGDRPNGGEKGVYHINAVDEVTQGVAAATRRFNAAHRGGLSGAGFAAHAASVSFSHLGLPLRQSAAADEFINKTVAQLLEKLRVEQTRSRPRQSGDNGLVESKNGSPRRLLRKHIGYGYIDASHADRINDFYREYLNPYLNYPKFVTD